MPNFGPKYQNSTRTSPAFRGIPQPHFAKGQSFPRSHVGKMGQVPELLNQLKSMQPEAGFTIEDAMMVAKRLGMAGHQGRNLDTKVSGLLKKFGEQVSPGKWKLTKEIKPPFFSDAPVTEGLDEFFSLVEEVNEPSHDSCPDEESHNMYRNDNDAFDGLETAMDENVDEGMKPEFEKLVKQYALKVQHAGGDAGKIAELLRTLMHSTEETEGEDPSELDEVYGLFEAEDDKPDDPRRKHVNQPAQRSGGGWSFAKHDKPAHWTDKYLKPDEPKERPQRKQQVDPNRTKYGPGPLWDPQGPDDELVDYPADQMHPKTQADREQLKKHIDAVSKSLEDVKKKGEINDPRLDKAIEMMKQIHSLPAERVLPMLSNLHDALHKIRKQYTQVNPEVGNAMKDALLGIPSIMKTAAAVSKTTHHNSEKDLWKSSLKMRPMRAKGEDPNAKASEFLPVRSKETGNNIRVTRPLGMKKDDEPKSPSAKEPAVRKPGEEDGPAPLKPKLVNPSAKPAPSQATQNYARAADHSPSSSAFAVQKKLHPNDPRNKNISVQKKPTVTPWKPDPKDDKKKESWQSFGRTLMESLRDTDQPLAQELSRLFGMIERSINDTKQEAEDMPLEREEVFRLLDDLQDHTTEVFRHLIDDEKMRRWVRRTEAAGH